MKSTLKLGELRLAKQTKPRKLPERQRLRKRIVKGLEVQKEAAQAEASGQEYQYFQERWVNDPQTGRKELKKVPVRFRPWWWSNEMGNVYMGIRYGYRFIEIREGFPSIEVGHVDNLPKVINSLIEIVQAGELDDALANAAKKRTHKNQ